MRNTTILIVLFILSGCATSSYFLTGGNRAAGFVTLTCNYDITTSCEPNYQEMKRMSSEACRNWGYSGAKAFGGVTDIETDDYGGYLEMQYQCIGDLES